MLLVFFWAVTVEVVQTALTDCYHSWTVYKAPKCLKEAILFDISLRFVGMNTN